MASDPTPTHIGSVPDPLPKAATCYVAGHKLVEIRGRDGDLAKVTCDACGRTWKCQET